MAIEDYFRLEPASGPPIRWGANKFPDGQVQFWIEREDAIRLERLTASLAHSDHMELFTQISAMLAPIPTARITYLYGARSDKDEAGTRLVSNVAALSLSRVAIALETELVTPHCEQLPDPETGGPLSRAFKILKPLHPEIQTNENRYDAWLFPDASAQNRFGHLVPPGVTTLVCSKQRDQVTGEILNHGIPPLDGVTRLLVIDDLCDGGRTFIDVAHAVGKLERLDLYVTHGVFSNNAPTRLYEAGFDNIYVTNSLPTAADAHRDLHMLDVWAMPVGG